MRVAVIGAGVIGVTSALAVKRAFPDFQVDIFADVFSPDTTGDGSAGLWGPYLLGDTPPADIVKWAGMTHRWLQNFWKSGLASKTGISLVPVYRLSKNPEEASKDPMWLDLVYGARKLNDKDLQDLNTEHKTNYRTGWQFVTFTSEPVYLLPWLVERFIVAGGRIIKRKIHTLEELTKEGYDLIINCSGLGARDLVGDKTVSPLRGQVSRVKASWAMHSYIIDDDDGNYIIPNIDSVVLGGTHQENDFDCTVREEDSNFIHNGCYRMMPGLKNAERIREWVGLRPGRPRVRLEPEVLRTPGGQEYTVIHNYGHGGSGVTLCWGCALDVVKILKSMKLQNKKSKL